MTTPKTKQVNCDECGTSLTVPTAWAREATPKQNQALSGELYPEPLQSPLCKPCWDTLFEKKYGHPYKMKEY